MTHVINQGMAMYWGTSRWSAMEIMVKQSHKLAPGCTFPAPRAALQGVCVTLYVNDVLPAWSLPRKPTLWPGSST